VSAAVAEGRTWRLEFPPGMRLLNENNRLHWAPKAELIADLRRAGWALAKQHKVPRLERARIDAVYHPRTRTRCDSTNWAPTYKALVDGLRDAGVLPDDDHTHLDGPHMAIGELRSRSQVVLTITNVGRVA
jgi:crossover junction endodeoxyribonuclease RusA